MKLDQQKQLLKALENGLKQLKLPLSPTTQEKLIDYLFILSKWNRTYNLVATDDPEEILTQHILDSLSVVPYLNGQRIIDVGTGAGLPGIPLALAFPEKQIVLLDSIGKKVRFLTQAIAELKITNAQAIQTRVEAFCPDQCFDVVITRAVGSINAMIMATQHLLCPQGELLMMKGLPPEAELKDVAWQYRIYPLQVPSLNKQRHLVCLQRV